MKTTGTATRAASGGRTAHGSRPVAAAPRLFEIVERVRTFLDLTADPGAPSGRLRETRRALYELYTAWGRPEAAAAYRGADESPQSAPATFELLAPGVRLILSTP